MPNDFGINRADRVTVTNNQDLKHALKDEWELHDITVIPVMVDATCIMKDNLQELPGQHTWQANNNNNNDKYQIQRAAISGTVSLLEL